MTPRTAYTAGLASTLLLAAGFIAWALSELGRRAR